MTAARRISAIFAADIAGYSRLIGGDEESPIAAFRAHLLANELPLMRKRVNSLTDREWPRFHPTEPIRLASTNDPNGARRVVPVVRAERRLQVQ